ncbi:hypothetical protein N7530_000221 [Penicillium desertorum]|uniref:Intradiol ring-cleavage dioxygenases domain-containing protein n=1 Tax=Penicillium desertorum TaxID=1303715 RepID=A0A9W9X8C1_9EURO|nr:hypothetical protein N7530_000221 [Penicillium desertorum]
MHMKSALNLAILGCALLASAHPGHHEPLDSSDVQLYKRNVQAGLQKCSTEFQKNGLQARAEARRKAMVDLHRRHLRVRDTDAVLNKSHQATRPMSPSMSEKEIFNSPEKVCLLGPSPEGETGPYWLPGERVRSHIREGQPGVPVVIEQQYIDVETCKPAGNSADLSNRNRTFLRGIQKTDSDGVVTFDTLFPGHYDSRTTHYHNIAHFDAKRLPNNTIAGGRVSHVAQIFWDQDIINAVESTYPYNTNNIPITPNAEDRVVGQETQNTEADPMLNYAYLGDRDEDGLFAWITVAVNLSVVHYPYYTNVYTENGGMAVDGTSDGNPRVVDGGLPQTSSVSN